MRINNCRYYKGKAVCYHSNRNFICFFTVDPYSCPDFVEGDAPHYQTPSAKRGEKGGECIECDEKN